MKVYHLNVISGNKADLTTAVSLSLRKYKRAQIKIFRHRLGYWQTSLVVPKPDVRTAREIEAYLSGIKDCMEYFS